MKKLFTVLMLILAMNFLAAAGGVSWLYQSKHLDRQKIIAIRDIVFPAAAKAPATQPAENGPATQPILRLEELLARANGRSAAEQVEFIQHAFDAQMAQLDRRQRELNDQQRQVDLAKQQMARDRVTLLADQQKLNDQQQQQTRLASDKGFQDSLLRYQAMPAKQARQIFMTLDDQTTMNYLQAMEPRTAARIIKE